MHTNGITSGVYRMGEFCALSVFISLLVRESLMRAPTHCKNMVSNRTFNQRTSCGIVLRAFTRETISLYGSVFADDWSGAMCRVSNG